MAEDTTLLYRIVSAADWRGAQSAGVVAYSDLDRRDGYMHLSTFAQVLETAGRYFSGRTDLIALEIDATKLDGEVRFEASTGGALFPHLYGALPVSAVVRARPLEASDSGSFGFDDEAPE